MAELANGMEWEEEEDTGLDWLCPDNIDAAGESLNMVCGCERVERSICQWSGCGSGYIK